MFFALPEVSPVLTTFAIVPILWAWGLDLQQTNPCRLLKLAMLGAIVANHERGRAYVRGIAAMMIVIVFIPRASLFSAVISETGSSKTLSRGGANCVEQAVTNYQGFQHELGTVRVRGTQL